MSATTTLANIANQIDDGECLLCGDFETFSRMINATGPLNQHLRFTPEPRRYDRTVPIDINSHVYGDYLTVMYDSHWPKLELTEHDDRDQLAEYVLDWVLLRCEVFAFERGRRLRHRVEYDDANGPRRHYQPNMRTPVLRWIGT